MSAVRARHDSLKTHRELCLPKSEVESDRSVDSDKSGEDKKVAAYYRSRGAAQLAMSLKSCNASVYTRSLVLQFSDPEPFRDRTLERNASQSAPHTIAARPMSTASTALPAYMTMLDLVEAASLRADCEG